jgi:hypothetical protein
MLGIPMVADVDPPSQREETDPVAAAERVIRDFAARITAYAATRCV